MGPTILPGCELRCPLPFSPFSMDDVAPWKGSLADGRTLRLSGQDPQQSAYRALPPEGWREPGKWRFP